MSYTINPNAKNKWARNAENTMDLSLETDASSVYLDNGRTLEQELGEGSMVSNVTTVDSSMSKIIDGTLDGAYESGVMYGKTMVNGLSNPKIQQGREYVTMVSPTHLIINHGENLSEKKINVNYDWFGGKMEDGADYTLDIWILKNTMHRKTDPKASIGKFNFNSYNAGFYSIPANTLGHITYEVTTSNVNTGGKPYIETFTTCEGELEIQIVIRQGKNLTPIEQHFEGICDVKMPILRNVGSLHPFPNGLLCWYDARSGEGEQTFLEDLSGNENHATLHNFQFGGTDGWQDGGIRIIGYGMPTEKNSIRTNKQINNAKSMCIYFKRLGNRTPWYLFDGRESSTLYWYSDGYSGSLINHSNSSKNGVQLSANNDAVLPEIGDTAMVYIEFTDNIPITPTLMGRYNKSESLDGVFYAFMLYDRALTTDEVAINMEYAKSFDHIKDISPLDFRNIDKTNILRTSEEIVLRDVGGVQDTYNLLTGEYVRRIGEVVLDGSEDWIIHNNDHSNRIVFKTSSKLSGYNTTTSIADKIRTSKITSGISNPFGYSFLRIGEDTAAPTAGVFLHLEGELTSMSNVAKLIEWLQANPITVQYELKTPITTIVESLTTPFAYQNGNIILESGYEGQSLLPTLEYSTVVNKTGLIENVAKTIQRQEKQLTMLEKMLIQNIINLDYNNTLLTLKNEMEEML